MNFRTKKRNNGYALTGLFDKDQKGVFCELDHYGHINFVTSKVCFAVPAFYEGENVVELSGHIFEECSDMEIIIIPKTVKTIHWNGIHPHLNQIIVDDENPYFQSIDGVLYTKKGYNRDGKHVANNWRELVAYPTQKGDSYRIIEGTTKLCYACFKYTSISTLFVPKSVKEIEFNAFYECRNLNVLRIPKDCEVKKGKKSSHYYTEFVKD